MQTEVQIQEIPLPTIDTEVPMEEVRGEIDLKGLDLVSLEEACKNNAMHAITPKQIQLLTDILQSPNTKSKLGVVISHLKDSKRSIKEAKKKRRKSYIQRLVVLGTNLVESGQYSQLTKFFPSNPPVTQ